VNTIFPKEKRELTLGQKKSLYLLLAFFLPFLVMIIALAGLQVTPFGDDTLLMSDAGAYYINYLSYAARMWTGHEGILYSLERGLGGSMASYINGAMMTPFAVLLSLVNIADYPAVYTMISVLNFSLSGLTMYIFLADCFGHKRNILIFSTSYALMGFNVANVFQAVFFCAPPVLPIMVVGLRRILKGKSPLIYILSIAYGLITNAYFGYVLCAASLIFFCVGFWQQNSKIKKGDWKIVVNYAISSLCAGFMTAISWLPGFLSMKGGRLEQTKIGDYNLWENMPFIEIGTKLFTGANNGAQEMYGLPNIFVGILPLILCIILFRSDRIKKKDKLSAAILIGIYLLSFWLVCLNMVMHAGTSPNWFNYRYSYVFSFILLVIAAQAWQTVEEISRVEVEKALAVLVVAVLIIFSKKYGFIQVGTMLLDFVVLGLILLIWRMHKRNPQKNTFKHFEIAVIELVCLNLLLNYSICTHKLFADKWQYPLEEYQNVVKYVDPLVQGVKAKGTDFYRMEINEQRSANAGNDPMLYGYYGIGHSGSLGIDFEKASSSALGIPWYNARLYYAKGVPAATDDLFGLRYIISRDDMTQEKGYGKIIDSGEWGLYYNEHALSPVFLSKMGIKDVKNDLDDVFDNLNRTWMAISGVEKEVFTEEANITFEAHNSIDDGPMTVSDAGNWVLTNIFADAIEEPVSEENSDGSGGIKPQGGQVSTLKKPNSGSYISYYWTAKQDGPVYIYNGYALDSKNGCTIPTVQYIGTYKKGDEIRGYMPVSGSEFVSEILFKNTAAFFKAAYANHDVLAEMSSMVKDRPTTVSRIKDSHLKGEFSAAEDQTLVFTIPYNEGWTLFIDGKKADFYKVLDLLIATDVSAGSHVYEMKYTPPGFRTGKYISVMFVLIVITYMTFGKRIWYISDRSEKI